MVCKFCKDTGHMLVSVADPENGPADDPNDEWEDVMCEHCPEGPAWYELQQLIFEAHNREYFASIGLNV